MSSLKNTLIKSIVKLAACKKNSADTERDQKFLCVSTTGLGDTLWATPALRALRERFAKNYIGVLTSPMGKELLLHNPHIDELFVVDSPALLSLCAHYRKMKNLQLSCAFIFHTSQRPVLPFVALLGVSRIVGTKGINKDLDCFLTHPLPREPQMHEIERRLQMLSVVGAKSSSVQLELFLDQEDERRGQSCLASSLKKPFIALHPGSKDAFKRWPASHFIDLGKRLLLKKECTLFITGTPEERALVQEIAAELPSAVMITHLPVRSFAAFIQKMDLFITNDTGPMHIAFAMKTPTIALFSPTNPLLCGPYAVQKVINLVKSPTCIPCLKRKCPFSFCLLQIGSQEVYDAALRLLDDNVDFNTRLNPK